MRQLSFRYQPHLPLVLKQISFEIHAKEKVGIVGRTGAGKSSIIQALFRIAEPLVGSTYEINGVDALQLGLHTLRHQISVIPQTPFLFKGTIRINLDPFGEKADAELWKVLEATHLKGFVEEVSPG